MTEETKTETSNALATLTSANVGQMVTSIQGDPADRATSVKIFNAMNNPAERVSAHINEVIEVENYLVEITQIQDTDAEGNELESFSIVPRVVLVTPDGVSYQAVSQGMANVIKKLIAVCGDAPWEPALKLKIKQQPTKKGSMLTAELVG